MYATSKRIYDLVSHPFCVLGSSDQFINCAFSVCCDYSLLNEIFRIGNQLKVAYSVVKLDRFLNASGWTVALVSWFSDKYLQTIKKY